MVAQLVQVQRGMAVGVSETIFNFLSRLIHIAFGSNRLRHYEQVCIAAWRSKLPKMLQQKLDKQLVKFDLVQRQARGTKSVFYSVRDPQFQSWGDDDFFPVREEDYKVFAGTLTGKIDDVTESVQFSVYLHRGRLSSLEFSSELGALASLPKGLLVEAENQWQSMGLDSEPIGS